MSGFFILIFLEWERETKLSFLSLLFLSLQRTWSYYSHVWKHLSLIRCHIRILCPYLFFWSAPKSYVHILLLMTSCYPTLVLTSKPLQFIGSYLSHLPQPTHISFCILFVPRITPKIHITATFTCESSYLQFNLSSNLKIPNHTQLSTSINMCRFFFRLPLKPWGEVQVPGARLMLLRRASCRGARCVRLNIFS